MKKFFLMLAACFMLTLVSCGGADYDAIAKKIDKQEKLSSSDYSAMIDYMEEASKNEPTNADYEESMAWAEKNYPHYMEFAMTLGMAEASGGLDDSQKKRLEKLVKEEQVEME